MKPGDQIAFQIEMDCDDQAEEITGEGSQKAQTSSYKISHGNAMYSMVTIVNNTVLHI